MTNLAENLAASAARFPDRPALRLGDTTVTYAEFDDLAGRAAGRMAALGVQPGDRVGLMLPNVLEFPVLFYGALRLGAIVVTDEPAPQGARDHPLHRRLRHVLLWAHESVSDADTGEAVEGCRVERVDAGLLPSLADVEPVPAAEKEHDDTAVILYTSGTTGTPKGAELTHGGLDRNLRVCTEELMTISPSRT